MQIYKVAFMSKKKIYEQCEGVNMGALDAAVCRCSSKYSQENICVGVSFL